MDQTIPCTVLLCRRSNTLFVLSERSRQTVGHPYHYGGRTIEAAEADEAALPGVPQIPTHWLERLRTQAQSNDRRLNLELADEFSGGDPIPLERPYFPWDLARDSAQEQAEAVRVTANRHKLPF